MLSGGEALENYALRNASSVLRALANWMPAIAHRKEILSSPMSRWMTSQWATFL